MDKSVVDQFLASIPSKQRTPALMHEIGQREAALCGELRKIRYGILNQLYQAQIRIHPALKEWPSKEICELSKVYIDRATRLLLPQHLQGVTGLPQHVVAAGWAEAYKEAQQRTCREIQIDTSQQQQVRLIIGNTCGDKILLDNYFKNGMYQARRGEGDHRDPEVLGGNRKRLIEAHMPEALLVLKQPTNGGKNFNYVAMPEALDSWFLAMEDEWYQKSKKPIRRKLFSFKDPRYWNGQ